MLWGNKLCFCLLSKLLCRFYPSSVALREESDVHQRIWLHTHHCVVAMPGAWALTSVLRNAVLANILSWKLEAAPSSPLCRHKTMFWWPLMSPWGAQLWAGTSTASASLSVSLQSGCLPAAAGVVGRATRQGCKGRLQRSTAQQEPGCSRDTGGGVPVWHQLQLPNTSPRRKLFRHSWRLISTSCSCSKCLSAGCG